MAINPPTKSVAADMDRIFRPLNDRSVPAIPLADRPVPARRWRKGRAVTFAAPALVLLATTALAIGYVRQAQTPPSRAAATPPAKAYAAVVPTSPTPPRPMPSDMPTGSDDASPMPQENGGGDVTMANAAAAAGSVPLARMPAAVSPRPRPAVRPAYAATRTRSATPAASAPGNRVSPSFRARTDAEDAASAGRCPPGSNEDRCIYQDVLAADARLRRAYRQARQGGVPTWQLTEINQRWRRARDLAQDDPDGTIQRYDRLADQLDRARQGNGE
ncbi:hypothetical protein [Sphingomonas sp. CARO-RG-8B-R24-01]|uniref:hypothetical protein n=1 Tax=Sphingomonas sp. CARO-RG-8B-R24-01 TaxID=2914831 RepID=UPI001F56D9D9|nr:hypothetical protein [Sphingomonas sp. CARO-RG-8B-R24-01]